MIKKVFFVLLLASPSYGVIAPVIATHIGKDGMGVSSTTVGINTTGATLLVISIANYYQDAAGTAPSDSKGNTWHTLTNRGATTCQTTLWYAWDHGGSALSVGSGHTFTVTGSYFGSVIYALSGTQTDSDPFDVQNGGSQGATKSYNIPDITPTVDDEVVIISGGYDTSTTGYANDDAGYSVADARTYLSGYYTGNVMWYKVQTSKTATGPTISDTGANGVICAEIASFKAGGGAPPPAATNAPFFGTEF